MKSSITIDLKRGIYCPEHTVIRIGSRYGNVYCHINDKTVEFSTVAAHKAGFALVVKASQAIEGEFIEMKVNNRSIQMLPGQAIQVGGALLRKIDDADDFQLARGKPNGNRQIIHSGNRVSGSNCR